MKFFLICFAVTLLGFNCMCADVSASNEILVRITSHSGEYRLDGALLTANECIATINNLVGKNRYLAIRFIDALEHSEQDSELIKKLRVIAKSKGLKFLYVYPKGEGQLVYEE